MGTLLQIHFAYTPIPPNKQNKVHNITNPNNIYHLNDPNTKVPITNTLLSQTKTKREIIKNLYIKGIHNTYIPNLI